MAKIMINDQQMINKIVADFIKTIIEELTSKNKISHIFSNFDITKNTVRKKWNWNWGYLFLSYFSLMVNLANPHSSMKKNVELQ